MKRKEEQQLWFVSEHAFWHAGSAAYKAAKNSCRDGACPVWECLECSGSRQHHKGYGFAASEKSRLILGAAAVHRNDI
jgi:hypothetical protein